MRIKRYYSKNEAEGFLKVRRELGPEAIILQTRKVRPRGLKSLFSPSRVEITAALDRGNSFGRVWGSAPEPGAAGVEAELKGLKKMVELLVDKSAGSGRGGGERLRGFQSWRSYLEKQDIDPVIIDDLLAPLTAGEGGAGANWGSLVSALQKELSRRLAVAPEGERRILALIGPTGVGKTTTVAKLAARYALTAKERVGLVTLDHCRLGAVEQLRGYAGIIDLPLEVAATPDDLERALQRLGNCDRILVDTGGRTTGNHHQIDELLDYIKLLLPAEIHLVISATTRWQDIRHITGTFMKLKYNRLLITKLDETLSFGAVLNGAYHSNQPLAYLTDGQSVPGCLKLAREMDWSELFLGGKQPGGRDRPAPFS